MQKHSTLGTSLRHDGLRPEGQKQTNPTTRLCLAALISGLLLSGCAAGGPDYCSGPQWPTLRVRISPRPFDAEAWRAGSPAERYAMHESLLALDTLRGLTRHEVEALLGPPSWYFPGNSHSPEPTLSYLMDSDGVRHEPNALVYGGPLVVRLDSLTQRVDTAVVASEEC